MSRTSTFPALASMAALALCALPGPATADLPRSYEVQRIDSPNPAVSANFGAGALSAGDLNGDGADDLLLPQSATGPGNDGQVFVVSGEDGAVLSTINAPDQDMDAGGADAQSTFGTFASKLADLGSCAGGTSATTCPTATIGAPDNVPEILVGATGIDVRGTTDVGRAYVIDGATRAVLKRIDMPAADISGPPAQTGDPAFGRTVLNPRGQAPCTGNSGIGACGDEPVKVQVGDMSEDAANTPDIVVGAPAFNENAASNRACPLGAVCSRAGRAYIYHGEDIAGTDPAVIESSPNQTIRNPIAQADIDSSVNSNTELMSQAVYPVGDIGGNCGAPNPGGSAPYTCPSASSVNIQDGVPDVLISAFRTDDAGQADVGVNYIVDGRSGAILYTYRHPEPQTGSIFGFTLHNEPAAGNLGDSPLPDIFIPAMRQNVDFTAQGRGYVMTGNFRASTNNVNFAQVNDPTPSSNSNFGVSSAGVGDLVPGAGAPNNELLIGAFGPHNPGTKDDVINDVHIFNPLNEQSLQSIADPDQQPGSSFGTAVAPIGDSNDDGFVDLAVAADLFDAAGATDVGRLYILRSDNSPAPPETPPAGPPAGPRGPAGPPGPARGSIRSGRTLEVAARRQTLRRGQRTRVSGLLEAFANPAACERGVAVRLQRRPAGRLAYRTVKRLRTSRRGTFSLRVKPGRTSVYRARVSQSAQCAGAASNRTRVNVKRRRR